MKHFVVIVDNEVVTNVSIPEENDNVDVNIDFMNQYIAIYSSDPRFIPYPETAVIGSTWDGTTFTPPVE